MRVHSLAFQWLGLTPLTAKGTGSIPGHDPQAMRHGQKKKIISLQNTRSV